MVFGIRTTDKMMKIQLVVSLLVACAWASKTRCPIALGKYPFSDTKFAGNWYFIAGTPMDGTELCKCGKYTLDQQKNGEESFFQLKYTAVAPDGSDVSIEGHSKPYKTERSSLKLGVWKKEGSDTWNGVYKQSIVATDYDSYAVIVACRHIFDDKTKAFGRDLMAQVWSRNQTLTKDVQDVLVSFLSGYDVDPDSIKIVDRTNCA